MKVSYRKRFLKQLAKIPLRYRSPIEKFVFEELLNTSSIAEIGKIEKMAGYSEYYKARFGPYRVGMKKGEDTLIIEVVMDRKDIYKFFP